MEHHYSLTGRMLAIFVGGLILLAILIFAAGLLAGREWGAGEAAEQLAAAQRGRTSPAPTAPAAAAAAAAAAGTTAAAGAIRPPGAAPTATAPSAPPPAPANPAAAPLPALPKLPAVPTPALPKVPKLPALPSPAKSSDAGAAGAAESARMARAAPVPVPAKVPKAASARPEAATESDATVHGYVVYVGAFENTAKAESLVGELKSRNLDAQTSVVAKPGRRPLLTVWVGPFDGRADAVAILPAIREAGVEDAMIRAVP